VVLSIALPSCGREDLPAAPEAAGQQILQQRAVNGSALSVDAARRVNESLARHLALALADDSLRALVWRGVRQSPFREHKVEFRRFTDSEGARVLSAMSAMHGVGVTRSQMAAFRDSTVPLELYVPVPAHFEAWQGGNEVLVATGLEDEDAPIAYDVAGNRIALSPTDPPTRPVLALVPVETRFGTQALLPHGNATCTPTEENNYCDGGGGGGGIVAPHGIYLLHSYLYDDGEGWLRGSPEIEVMLMAPYGDTLHVARYNCANEDRSTPRYFNQDSQTWNGMVLLADSAELEAIRSLYPPGTPWDGVRFSFAVWEDDTDRCEIVTDSDSWTAKITNAAGVVIGGYVAITIDYPNDDPMNGALIMAGLAGLARLVSDLGSADDFLGVLVDRRAWNPTHPNDSVGRTHAIVLGSQRNGRADLLWLWD
jgi:hypothetical protein